MGNGDKPKAISSIFLGFVQVFTNSMKIIEPTKNDPDYPDLTFEERYHAWQMAFKFSQRLAVDMAGFADYLVHGGNKPRNLPDLEVRVNNKFVKDLNDILNSGKFNEYMNIAKPQLPPDDHNAEEKIKSWEDSFNVTSKLQKFAKDVQNQIDHSEHGYITLVGYFGPISGLISKLKSN